MNWRVVLSAKAERQVDDIRGPDLDRLRRRILGLALEPRPFGSGKLEGSLFYRLRAGDWRIIYRIDDERLLVAVVQVLRRCERTYRNL